MSKFSKYILYNSESYIFRVFKTIAVVDQQLIDYYIKKFYNPKKELIYQKPDSNEAMEEL